MLNWCNAMATALRYETEEEHTAQAGIWAINWDADC